MARAVNAIASLLERAKAQAIAETIDDVAGVPPASPALALETNDPWPAGAWVELVLDGIPPTFGRVGFVDDGWVHWTAMNGSSHASRADALRRCR